MTDPNLCEHARRRDGNCRFCKRDEKLGKRYASEQMRKDPGFRKAVEEYARQLFVASREKVCKAAVQAAVADRERIERALELGEGVWWSELSPLTAPERTIVLNQLRRQWRIRDDAQRCECPRDDVAKGIHYNECRGSWN